jgi:hypothetical protein
MSRNHAIAFAVLLAFNAVVGTVALTRTLHLGQASQKASRNATSAVIAKRTTQLDRFEASLKVQLAKKPPRLPKVSSAATYAAAAPSTAAVASSPPVRYVRPAPIIVHKHRPGGATEAEGYDRGDGGGGDD